MPEQNPTTKDPTRTFRIKPFLIPAAIFFLAGGIIFLIAGNWDAWASEHDTQKTDDAYLRADLTPLSTKVAGLVASVSVSDYQAVKSGSLLVKLQDEDFRGQVGQAVAGVQAGEYALINNQRQKELQDARIRQAEEGIRAADAEVTAAEAGIDAAKSSIANARSGIDGVKADAQRAGSERRRQEALFAVETATRQKLEQVVADEERYKALLQSRESDVSAATAQLASREADLARAKSRKASTQAELEAQERQRAVVDSQGLQLRADLNAKKASLDLARTNLGYTQIIAPTDGIVSERRVRPGQLVSPGTQVISLVEKDVWIQANFKETQVRHFQPG